MNDRQKEFERLNKAGSQKTPAGALLSTLTSLINSAQMFFLQGDTDAGAAISGAIIAIREGVIRPHITLFKSIDSTATKDLFEFFEEFTKHSCEEEKEHNETQ